MFRLYRFSIFLALVACLILAPAATSQIIYVDADATGGENGTSWADAYEELDEALEVAAGGAQIWVAEGVYKPTDDPDRTESFFLKSGVEVLGGFTGTETSADDRIVDPEEGGTVLSGDIGTIGDPSDNSYHVVTAIGVDETAVLDGFLVTGGNADESSAPHDRGGGLTNYDGQTTAPDTEGSPTLRHLVFSNNSASFGGGGVYLNTSPGTVVFEDVEFKENRAGIWGGGLYSRAFIEMESVEFEDNTAGERGGGVHLESRTALIRDAEFDGNRTPGVGAGLHIERGTEATLIDVVFEGNIAPTKFQANRGFGAGIYARDESVLDVVNATFIGNVAWSGIVLVTDDATVRITNAAFAGNWSQGGGVIRGVIDSSVTLTNVTMSGNRATSAVSATGGTRVNNSIVWDNEVEVSFLGSAQVDHAIIEGGLSGGEAVLSDDPLFLRAPDAGPDGEWGTDDDDYGNLRLDEGSPALGFGDLDLVPEDEFDLDGDGVTGELLPFDLDSESRVQDGNVELGAYEGTGSPVSSEDGASVTGAIALAAAYPNPARGRSTLVLTLDSAERVEVAVYDVLGRRVARLHDGPLASGTHPFTVGDAALPAGLYLVRAASAAGTVTRRVTIVR